MGAIDRLIHTPTHVLFRNVLWLHITASFVRLVWSGIQFEREPQKKEEEESTSSSSKKPEPKEEDERDGQKK
jgi:hypothetical protein